MIELHIPGRGLIQLEHIVLDLNGTLALDGQLIDGVARCINQLRDRLQVHLVTADTHGKQELIEMQLNLKAQRIQPGRESEQKADFVRHLGAEQVVAIGQGLNDADMLEAAGIGICILSQEGAALQTMLSADLVMPDIFSALGLLEKPLRLVATLRK